MNKSAKMFLWAGEAESEERVEQLTEWQYGENEDDYKSWLEKSFDIHEYDQSFRSIGMKKSEENLRELILSISYGEQYVEDALRDIETMIRSGSLKESNVIFVAMNVDYDKQVSNSSTQGLALTFVGEYSIEW